MNIWIVNQYASSPDTGMGGRHYLLAKELVSMGHSVHVICAGYHHLLRAPIEQQEIYSFNVVDGVNFVRIKMPKYDNAHAKKRIFNWFLFSHRVSKVDKYINNKPDVILISSPSLVAYRGAKKLARKTKAKLCFEVRDIWPLTLVELGGFSERHPFIRYLQKIEDQAYEESSGVISNLPNAVEHMVSRGMNKDKFVWIPNGFSPDEIAAQVSLEDSAIEKIPTNKFIIGYLGTLGAANALEYLIEAAKLLKDESDIHFLIVGQGRQKEALLNLVNKLELNNVSILDPIPKTQVQSMLSYLDVCYIGLTKDPIFRFGVSPNKLFDYFISAKPVLYAIDSGNKPVDDSNSGISVNAENPDKIAEAILKFKSMPLEKLKEMGQNGKKYALDNYSYKDLAQNLISFLEKLN